MTGTHHIGITVADLERSARFWSALLEVAPGPLERLRGPALPRLVGYPAASVDRRWLTLPGGPALELLQYREPAEPGNEPGTARPGNVHVCLAVEDLPSAHRHAVTCGAVPVTDGGWIEVPAGAQAGARIAYLRDPDGVTIEFVQHPPEERNDT